MSFASVSAWLKERGYGGAREFAVSSATVELAAQAVGVEPDRIAKTLSFYPADGAGAMLVVASGGSRIDNKKFKAAFGHKARMLSADEALERTGHAVGGVCPFALKSGVQVFLDESLKKHGTVFPACGSGNSAIELTAQQLEELTGGTWVDVCKAPGEQVG